MCGKYDRTWVSYEYPAKWTNLLDKAMQMRTEYMLLTITDFASLGGLVKPTPAGTIARFWNWPIGGAPILVLLSNHTLEDYAGVSKASSTRLHS